LLLSELNCFHHQQYLLCAKWIIFLHISLIVGKYVWMGVKKRETQFNAFLGTRRRFFRCQRADVSTFFCFQRNYADIKKNVMIEGTQTNFTVHYNVSKRFVYFYKHHYAIVSYFFFLLHRFFAIPPSRMFVECLCPFLCDTIYLKQWKIIHFSIIFRENCVD